MMMNVIVVVVVVSTFVVSLPVPRSTVAIALAGDPFVRKRERDRSSKVHNVVQSSAEYDHPRCDAL